MLNYALESLAYLPTRFFPAKSQLVFISPLQPDDVPVIVRMRALGYAVIVISPDPISFESSAASLASPAYQFAQIEREVHAAADSPQWGSGGQLASRSNSGERGSEKLVPVAATHSLRRVES